MLELFEKNSFMILFHIDQLKTIRLESIEGSHRRGAMSLPLVYLVGVWAPIVWP